MFQKEPPGIDLPPDAWYSEKNFYRNAEKEKSTHAADAAESPGMVKRGAAGVTKCVPEHGGLKPVGPPGSARYRRESQTYRGRFGDAPAKLGEKHGTPVPLGQEFFAYPAAQAARGKEGTAVMTAGQVFRRGGAAPERSLRCRCLRAASAKPIPISHGYMI